MSTETETGKPTLPQLVLFVTKHGICCHSQISLHKTLEFPWIITQAPEPTKHIDGLELKFHTNSNITLQNA